MKGKRTLSLTAVYVVLIIGVVAFSIPYIYMIVSSTQNNAAIVGTELNFKFGPYYFQNLKEVNDKYNYVQVLINSLVITVMRRNV